MQLCHQLFIPLFPFRFLAQKNVPKLLKKNEYVKPCYHCMVHMSTRTLRETHSATVLCKKGLNLRCHFHNMHVCSLFSEPLENKNVFDMVHAHNMCSDKTTNTCKHILTFLISSLKTTVVYTISTSNANYG